MSRPRIYTYSRAWRSHPKPLPSSYVIMRWGGVRQVRRTYWQLRRKGVDAWTARDAVTTLLFEATLPSCKWVSAGQARAEAAA